MEMLVPVLLLLPMLVLAYKCLRRASHFRIVQIVEQMQTMYDEHMENLQNVITMYVEHLQRKEAQAAEMMELLQLQHQLQDQLDERITDLNVTITEQKRCIQDLVVQLALLIKTAHKEQEQEQGQEQL